TASPVRSAVVKLEGRNINVGPYDDLGFQATTRGGRVMDHVLANKAVFKTGTDVAGTAAIVSGAIMTGSRDSATRDAGAGLLAAGVLAKIIAAGVTPQADTRTWDNLPRYLGFAAVRLPPGDHPATVEFFDRNKQLMPNLTRNITIHVPEDKRDKVVF